MDFKTSIIKLSTRNEQLVANFKPEISVTSPGRVNLIGEHTDYNAGYVLPTAIDKNIYFHLKKNGEDNVCNIYSKTYDSFLQVFLTSVKKSDTEWENYILGVVYELQKHTSKIKGFDCIIESKLPIGAGISSSAALECGLAFALNKLFDLQLSKRCLIELSRDAEHSFVGTKCGIMDQFASVMSEANHALLLDCKTLNYQLVPLQIDPYELLLLNTNVSHSLSTSEYNTRRKECEIGVQIIQSKYSEIDSLRSANLSILNEFKDEMSSIVYQRCSYVLHENQRVLAAADALKTGRLSAFGELMYASHKGLRNEYNVSCDELDFLVDFSKRYDTVLGSRMMGGGFGGCTINLIHKDVITTYVQDVSRAYKENFNIELSPILVKPSNGTSFQTY